MGGSGRCEVPDVSCGSAGIDEAGRATPIPYNDLDYSPREAEIRTFLTDWATFRYSMLRNSVTKTYPRNYYFLQDALASKLMQLDTKDATIAKVITGGAEEHDVQINNVTFTALGREQILDHRFVTPPPEGCASGGQGHQGESREDRAGESPCRPGTGDAQPLSPLGSDEKIAAQRHLKPAGEYRPVDGGNDRRAHLARLANTALVLKLLEIDRAQALGLFEIHAGAKRRVGSGQHDCPH